MLLRTTICCGVNKVISLSQLSQYRAICRRHTIVPPFHVGENPPSRQKIRSRLYEILLLNILYVHAYTEHIHAYIKRCCISFLPPPLPFFFHVGSAIGTAQQADGMKGNDVYSFIAYNCQRCCWEANGRDKRTNDQVLQGAKQIIGNIRIVGCFFVFLTRYKK